MQIRIARDGADQWDSVDPLLSRVAPGEVAAVLERLSDSLEASRAGALERLLELRKTDSSPAVVAASSSSSRGSSPSS